MTNTGTYIYDEELKKLVKVSEDIPKIQNRVWFPKHGYKYFDKALQKTFYSNTEKRNYLKAHGLKELPQEVSDKKRFNNAAEIVNTERKKQGLKSKTVSELQGNT